MAPSIPEQPAAKQIAVATFYKFVALPDCAQLCQHYKTYCQDHQIKGTLLLAAEGLNATLAGTTTEIAALVTELHQDERFQDIHPRLTYTRKSPFERLKVKVRPEIVTMGVAELDPTQQTGIHVSPQEWNALVQDPEVLVIDTRNQYEYDIGTFEQAVSPQTQHFREFPEFVDHQLDPHKHQKIAMFCTGGIRCEKASAYLLRQGFNEVYQLEGGILHYLAAQELETSVWEGECFVFDGRVAVNDELQPGSHEMCFGCRRPLSPADRQSERYEPGICCPYCYDTLTEDQRTRFAERSLQVKLATQRQEKHIAAVMPRAEVRSHASDPSNAIAPLTVSDPNP